MSHQHHPDGRLRLTSALLICGVAAATSSLSSLSIMLGLALLVTPLVIIRERISSYWLLKRLTLTNVFVLWIWLAVAIDWPDLSVHEEGVTLALQMTLRVNTAALAVSLLLAKMNGIELARAIVGLGLPQSLGALVAMAVRSIALLSETRARLEQAMRARGYHAKFGWRSIQVSAQLVAWLIIHALIRSERLELGLRSRGLSSMHWPMRRHGHWNSLPWSDWIVLGSVAAAIALAMAAPELWR